MLPTEEKVSSAADSKVNEDDLEYFGGLKLWSVLISGTLVQFVMMLDASIITTVSMVSSPVEHG